ncbi:MAG TPA: S9 family peptidase [Longimicrobiales bacterium]
MLKTMPRVAAAVLFVTSLAAAQQPSKALFTSVEEAVQSSGQLAGRSGPRSVNWIDSGARFAYTITNPTTRTEEIRRYDPATLKDELLLDTREVKLPGSEQPLQYRSFQWSKDSQHLLFLTNFRPIYRRSGLADFYMYSVPDKSLQLVAKDARTAELSPDGTMAGYERGGDMYVYNIAGKAEKRLTTGGNDSTFNGVFDWVYEEEFGMAQAWRWSPDSRYIAYWQTDETKVPAVQITDWQGHWPKWTKINFPKVGDPNPRVRIGVVDVQSGQTVWLQSTDTTEEYVPRIYWTSDPNSLAVLTLNRAQNDARLYFYDVRSGQRRLVMEEKARTFVDVYDFFAGVQDFLSFPANVREFFWLSDRDGYQHIYRYDYSGKLLNQVTRGPFMATRIEAIDPKAKTIYYSSTEVSPLERHLYAVKFDGKGKRRLTQEPGRHLFNMSPTGSYYIDTWSNVSTPRQVELWSAAPRKLTTFENNAAVVQWTASHAYSPVELFKFTTSDGVTLDGSMIKPPNFDASRKYPVILSIYGGPGSQQVYNAFATSGWDQYLAQRGFIVVGLNNRGSGNYSRDFQKMVYGQLGKWESHDFAEVGKWLAKQPYVQGDRMAIHGTSYGGYSTVFTMEQYPDVFRAGIANSPGTDWSLYDTIYTERYMGLLPENKAGYDAASAVAGAARLKGYLLLVHSGMDENVHPQHTMQLLTALLEAGKDAEFRFFPPGAHGAAFDLPSYMTMLKIYANTFCEQLKTNCEPVNLNEGKQPIF